MYDIAGERTGGGSPEWLTAQRPAQKHADAVQRLLDAGATILGKTICDEFFYSVAGTNAHYGTPTNVRAPGRLPGAHQPARRQRPQPACAILRSAATPAARSAFPPRNAGPTACGRRSGASIFPA
jgi:hypothetical protein